ERRNRRAGRLRPADDEPRGLLRDRDAGRRRIRGAPPGGRLAYNTALIIMNRKSILTKTGKGLMEATGKTSNLSRDLRNILKEIDGKVSVSDLSEKFDRMSEQKLLEALGTMEREGYVREFIGKQDEAPKTPAPLGRAEQTGGTGGTGGTHSDLDFTAFTPSKPNAKENEEARLQAQAQEIARQARATRAREEAAAKAKTDATAA